MKDSSSLYIISASDSPINAKHHNTLLFSIAVVCSTCHLYVMCFAALLLCESLISFFNYPVGKFKFALDNFNTIRAEGKNRHSLQAVTNLRGNYLNFRLKLIYFPTFLIHLRVCLSCVSFLSHDNSKN